MPDANGNAVRSELAVFSCLLLDPSLWPDADLTTDDFLLSDHKKIWQAFCRLRDEGIPFDLTALMNNTDDVDMEAFGAKMFAAGHVPQNFKNYVRAVRAAARERQFRRLHEQLGDADPAERPALLSKLLSLDEADDGQTIRTFDSIPDLATMDIPPIEYIVPALSIARNTVTLWAGFDGTGKSMLVQAMAVAVARGERFLGMLCQQHPVLYLDLENPAHMAQARLRMMTGEKVTPNLKFWGQWDVQDPPLAGSQLLLAMVKEKRPLVIVDPFRYFHDAEENSSTEMAAVMKYFRKCAAYGAAVVLLHHLAKTEGSTGRGSSAIHSHCDLAFLHELDPESSLVTIKIDKIKTEAKRTIVIRADFEDAKFEVTDAPWITSRNLKLEQLEQLIKNNPGISTKQLCAKAGGRKVLVLKLLEEGRGTLWTVKKELRGAKAFYPAASTCSVFPLKGGEHGNTSGSPPSCSGTPGNTSEQVTTSGSQQLCSLHGWHGDWTKPNGVKVCLKCHPELRPEKEVDSEPQVQLLHP